MKKQEQEAKEQGHQESQAMSKSLLTEELTKEAYQSYHLCLRVLQNIRAREAYRKRYQKPSRYEGIREVH